MCKNNYFWLTLYYNSCISAQDESSGLSTANQMQNGDYTSMEDGTYGFAREGKSISTEENTDWPERNYHTANTNFRDRPLEIMLGAIMDAPLGTLDPTAENVMGENMESFPSRANAFNSNDNTQVNEQVYDTFSEMIQKRIDEDEDIHIDNKNIGRGLETANIGIYPPEENSFISKEDTRDNEETFNQFSELMQKRIDQDEEAHLDGRNVERGLQTEITFFDSDNGSDGMARENYGRLLEHRKEDDPGESEKMNDENLFEDLVVFDSGSQIGSSLHGNDIKIGVETGDEEDGNSFQETEKGKLLDNLYRNGAVHNMESQEEITRDDDVVKPQGYLYNSRDEIRNDRRYGTQQEPAKSAFSESAFTDGGSRPETKESLVAELEEAYKKSDYDTFRRDESVENDETSQLNRKTDDIFTEGARANDENIFKKENIGDMSTSKEDAFEMEGHTLKYEDNINANEEISSELLTKNKAEEKDLTDVKSISSDGANLSTLDGLELSANLPTSSLPSRKGFKNRERQQHPLEKDSRFVVDKSGEPPIFHTSGESKILTLSERETVPPNAHGLEINRDYDSMMHEAESIKIERIVKPHGKTVVLDGPFSKQIQAANTFIETVTPVSRSPNRDLERTMGNKRTEKKERLHFNANYWDSQRHVKH